MCECSYVPAIFSNIVQICQRALCYLFGVMLKQWHPPHPVTSNNACLGVYKKTYEDISFHKAIHYDRTMPMKNGIQVILTFR